MPLILGYDVETTGLDLKNDYILEAAAVIYDTDTKQPVDFYSSLVLWPSRPIPSREAQDVHHISEKMLETWGKPCEEVFGKILQMSEKCKWIVGHNAIQFDRPITENAVLRCQDSGYLKRTFYGLKWMDTMLDLPFPENIKTRELEYLGHKHGYHPKGAHRALSDVLTCLYLLSCYDFNVVEQIASTPVVELEAKVSYTEKHKAKARGFYWNDQKRKWLKTTRQYWTSDKLRQLDFNVEITQ